MDIWCISFVFSGETIPGYSLKAVHVIMSPGQTDVSSNTKLGAQTFPRLRCDGVHFDNAGSAKLWSFKESVNGQTMRRRDHPDLKSFHPKFPTTCSKHHLTGQGFLQVSYIGKHLHEAYLNKLDHKQLKPHYSSVHIESVLTQPAYQSSLALLQSLLPKKQFEKSRIHVSRRNFCDKSESKLSRCRCAKVSSLSPHMSQVLGMGRQMFKASSPDTETVRQLFQLDSVHDISSLQLLQLLLQYECSKISPVCDHPHLCNVSADSLSMLHDVASDYLHSVYHDPVFQTYSNLKSYPFLQQLVSKTTSSTGNKTMFMYMGDDFFVQLLKTSLSLSYKEVTPLASR